jgi:hypothetical protein
MTLQGVLAPSTVAAIFYFVARTHHALPHIRQKIFYSRSTAKLARGDTGSIKLPEKVKKEFKTIISDRSLLLLAPKV